MKAIEKSVELEKIKKARPRVALDFGNGTSSLYADMFRRVADVSVINGGLDGRFPGRNSEPSEANVQKLVKLVKQGEFDAGFAWDGDADRFVMVDEKGNFVVGDRVFALSVLLKAKKTKIKRIITTVATSRAAQDIAERYCAQTIYTKVGAPYLSEAMHKGGADIAGEEVGGVVWKEISLAKDGPATAMKVLEAMAEKPLSQWLAELPQYCNAKTKITASAEMKGRIMAGFAAMQKGKNVVAVDGVRINFADSWVIVRASGTEDYIRIFAEAKTKEKAEKLVKEYEEKVKGLRL
ncbi:Phosphoglucomutase/phosphomannomutase [uncultured archaeon]|nr:Phosphoglucomutase/phosphomannomutase [uncultured archaeon]